MGLLSKTKYPLKQPKGLLGDSLLTYDQPAAQYGYRPDGTPKGLGYYGKLKRPDGDYSTELSIGVEMDGKEQEIPSLVPGLKPQEIDWLLNNGEMTDEIVRKAYEHAMQRMKSGYSPFFD